MGDDQSLSELQREWREGIKLSIAEMRVQLAEISRLLAQQREEYVKQKTHDELEERVKKLESDKQRFIGAMVVLNVIGAFVLWLFDHLVKK
jgi:translation initiation factor 6 (eIF-6)